MRRLGDIADICRSKNAGPFMLTVDFLFNSEEVYNKLKQLNPISVEKVAKLYKVPEDYVSIVYFDAVKALKISVPRHHSGGSRYDTDVFGSQQHSPLFNLEIDI